MSELEKARINFERNDRRLRISLLIMAAFVMLLMTALVVQTFVLQTTVVNNQATNRMAAEKRLVVALKGSQAQHYKTQAYIKCIGAVLIKPANTTEQPNNRTQADLDKCEESIK